MKAGKIGSGAGNCAPAPGPITVLEAFSGVLDNGCQRGLNPRTSQQPSFASTFTKHSIGRQCLSLPGRISRNRRHSRGTLADATRKIAAQTT